MLSNAIDSLNIVATHWADWVLVTCLNTAGLLAVIGAVWLVIRRHVSPQIGYWLFLLVPLKVLVPVQIGLPVAILEMTAPATEPAQSSGAPAVSVTPAPVARSVEGFESASAIAPSPRPSNFENHDALSQDTGEPTPIAKPVLTSVPSNASSRSDAPSMPRPSLLAVGMFVWLVGVLFLTGRWLVRHWRLHRQLNAAVVIDPHHYAVDLAELCRRAGVSSRVRFVESDRLSAPAVAGVFRPTMILPRELATALSPAQIEWAVLHELAHIGRRDLAVIMLQRLAAILHFFNPAVWIANRFAHRLREYACDDLASAWTGRSSIEAGEAFVQILRHATAHRTKPTVGLGILGLDSRGDCTGRVRRMLGRRENAAIRPSRWSVLGLILVAAIALPNVGAQENASGTNDPEVATKQTENSSEPKSAPTTQAKPQPADETADATSGKTFEVIVIGPDNEPVPNVEVEFRRPGKPLADDVLTGTFVKQQNYGTLIKANAHGRIVLNRSNLKKNIQFIIEQPGFGPYYYGDFNSSPPTPVTPDRVTVQLDRGWSIGSVIVDSEGEPISGVKIHPSIPHKRPPGVRHPIGIGTTLTTDEQGRWHYDSVPESMDKVFVEIDHPQYMPERMSLARGQYGFTFGKAPEATVTLKPGLTMGGRVTDESGKPVEGALLRVELFNDEREATTDADGNYQIIGCEPGIKQIVVSAEGKAIDAKKINIAPDMRPVNFEMQPGGTVRVRVLDHKGNPIPKARIFFQRWRGDHAYFAFDRVGQYANKEGVWEWNEAPHDEFTADITGEPGLDLSYEPLVAREEEYVFRLPPALVVTGKVVDASTKEPIKTFDTIPGARSQNDRISWDWSERSRATDGTYKVRFDRQSEGHLVRVEAPGYQAAISREVQYDEGQVTIDFALKKGINVATQILTPAGEPAGGAEIALGIDGSQISVKNGHIRDISTFAARATADEQGHFQFPPQNSDYQLVITHPTGYAHIKGKSDQKTKPITLTAWARVEGSFFAGEELVSDAQITIASGNLHSYGEDVPNIFEQCETTTGPGGEFTFNRVVPGPARIGRSIIRMVDTGATEVASSKMIPIETKPGQTLEIQIGGDGRPVVGRLVPPEGFEKEIIWTFADIDLRIAPPPRPDFPEDVRDAPKKAMEWIEEWKKTSEGKKWAAAQQEYERQVKRKPYYNASVARDGSFRIDNVTEGKYLLNVRFQKDFRLHVRQFVTVPPITDENQGKPIELGTLTLEE